MQNNDTVTDVAIIGAGTAGLNALREVRNAGKSFVLIDHGPLGTTCARVGCMPSKAVLHAGALRKAGVSFHSGPGYENRADADVLWQDARATRDRLAGGAADRTRSAAGERLIIGRARFIAPNILDVDGQRVIAGAFVVATGSTPVVPSFLDEVRERVLTTDTLFELAALPRSIGILGMGAIGLEMTLALSRLGVRVVGGDVKSLPAGISDPELGKRVVAHLAGLDGLTLWLGKPATVRPGPEGVVMSNGVDSEHVDCLLAALGRKPALQSLQLDAAGVALDDLGFPDIDPGTMRAGESALYFAGDINGQRPLQHEAADEGVIAGWNAARHGEKRVFLRRVPLSIVFSEPDIAAVGVPFNELDPERTIVGTASGQGNGRSRIIHAEDNLVRVYADRESGRLLGASILAIRGEHIAHLLAWAIQRGETAAGLLEMPFYHPSIEEMVQTALADIVKQQGTSPAIPTGLRMQEQSA